MLHLATKYVAGKRQMQIFRNSSEKKKGEERNTLEGIPLIEKIAIGEDRSNLNSPSKRPSFLHNC